MKKLFLQFMFISAVLISHQNSFAQVIPPATQWDKSFGVEGSDGIFALLQTSDGGYIFAGMSNSRIGADKSQACQGEVDYWVIKTDANGLKQWDKTYGGNDRDVLKVIQQTPDGGYILAGSSDSDISGDKTGADRGNGDYWLVKIDANGTKIWDRTIGSNNDDVLFSLQQTSDGGYIVAGYSYWGIQGEKSEPGRGDYDYWIVKTDANGVKQWDKTYGGPGFDQLNYIHQTADGGYLLGGWSTSGVGGEKTQPSNGNSDYWVIKVSSNGTKQWDKVYGGSLAERLTSLKQTPDGGFILAGHSLSDISGDKSEANKGVSGSFDYWVVKIDAQGNKIWDKTLGSNDEDEVRDIQLTSDGGFLLAGFSESAIGGDKSEANRGSLDFWLVKLDGAGNKIWDKTLGGSSIDIFWSVKQTTDGGYILGGNSTSGISGDKTEANRPNTLGYLTSDFWVIKLAPEVLGVNESLTTELKLFPNPTKGIINIEIANKKATQVLVYNALGQMVFTQSLIKIGKEEPIQLDLSKGPKGVYTIQVLSDNQVYTKKVVLQ